MTITLESLMAVYISKLLVNNEIDKYKIKDSDKT